MRIVASGEGSLTVEFEDEAELRAEEHANLSVGGLLLRPLQPLAPDTAVALTLRLAGGGEIAVAARVVAALPGGLALQLDGDPAAIVAGLRSVPRGEETEPSEETRTLWDSVRAMTPPQKALLAPKADRLTRLLLVQDSDPHVLFALLKNPRLTLDEVVRVAKSSFLSYQAAELILRTSPWMTNLDVRLALIHNPRLPLPFALRMLPTLPDAEVRAIAKGAATSMPLKQAALKLLHPT